MITLTAFLATLAILVVVHEFGHFQVARWCGVKVLKFSFGFGKPIYSKKIGVDQTEFLISAIPLGGYVKMLDERELSEKELGAFDHVTLARAFNRQPVWKRILIVLAGPVANLMLAVLLYWTIIIQGVAGIKPELGDIPAGSAASQAAFTKGDVIKQVAGKPVTTWQDVQWMMLDKAFNQSTISIQTTNENDGIVNHSLSLTALNKEDYDGDFLSKLGLGVKKPEFPALIGEVVTDSPAQKAGLRPDDLVLTVDGVAVKDWEFLVAQIQQSPLKSLKLGIQRNEQDLVLEVTPKAVEENGVTKGQMGAALKVDEASLSDALVIKHYSVASGLVNAVEKTWDTSLFSLKMLGNMLIGKVSVKAISGPVTIANYAGQSAHMGIKPFIAFLAMISISLGVLNLLPIPVLDGGHLLYYIAEIVKGSPVSESVMDIGQRVGMFIILLLMTCALYNDINRLIAG